MAKLNDKTMKQGFQVKSAQNGIYMMPVYEGKPIEEEEYEKLPLEVKSEFEAKSQQVQDMIFETLSEIKLIENKADKKDRRMAI